jgi:hypothetical protein
MPYKSVAQERYFNANRAKLERQGVNVDEWNAATAGKHIPERLGMPLGEERSNERTNTQNHVSASRRRFSR